MTPDPGARSGAAARSRPAGRAGVAGRVVRWIVGAAGILLAALISPSMMIFSLSLRLRTSMSSSVRHRFP